MNGPDLESAASSDGSSGGGRVAGGRSERQRFGRGRPGRRRRIAGIALLLVLGLAGAGLGAALVSKTRTDAASAARQAASYAPPSVGVPSSETKRLIAIVSDESAIASAPGVLVSRRWPRLLAGASGNELDVVASAGAGYTRAIAGGSTFVQAAARVPARADVVLFVGGAADADSSSLALARSATEAFSIASERAAGADVVAVGPLFSPSGTGDAAFSELRSTLRGSARIAGVRWVDPVAAGWLPTSERTDGLTEADERTVAERLRSIVDLADG